jgi:hypothetical protein
MTDRAIAARITRTGMRAVFNAQNTGLQLELSQIAIGTGGGTGYVPTGSETALRNEFARVAIGGGDYLSDFEVLVQSMFDGAPQGWVNEIGILDGDGNLFAVWSEINAPLAYKTAGVSLIVALTLALSEIPPNSLTIVAGGAAVNITIAGPFSVLASEIMRLQRRVVQSEVERLTPVILSTFS